jgi:signal transduction histidine kinase
MRMIDAPFTSFWRAVRAATWVAWFFPLLASAQFPGGLPPPGFLPGGPARTTPLAPVDPTQPRHEAGLPFVQTFDRRDYRGHAQVWCGVADASGLLYFGNYAQVLVYDGQRWDNIAVPGATYIRSLALDLAGRLWVGGEGAIGYIDTRSPAPLVFVSLVDRLPAAAHSPGDVTLVLPFGDSVYLQSHTWLFRWRNDAFEGWPLPQNAPPSRAMIIEGELVVQNSLHGWRHITPEGLTRYTKPLPSLSPTRFALPLPDSRWLYGTIFNGLFTYDGKTTTPLVVAPKERFRSNFLFHGLQLRDGRVALTFLTGGAVILDADLSFRALIDEAAGLPTLAVNGAFADAHGSLWLCLGEGMARVSDTFAATWFRPPTPFGQIDADAFTRFHGRLLLGVAPELRSLEPPAQGIGAAKWEIQSVLGPRQGGRLGALLPAGDSLLIAAADGCYAWKENQSSVEILKRPGCTALLASVAQPGRFFVGHAGGIDTLRNADGKWVAEGTLATLGVGVRSLLEERDGALWAGLDDGQVARLTFPAAAATPGIETSGPAAGLPAAIGGMRIVAVSGQPLFATGRGLYRFDAVKKRFTPETRFGARFADGTTRVAALAEDGKGDLWIAPQPAGGSPMEGDVSLGRASRDGQWHALPVPDLARIGNVVGLRLETADGREVLWALGVSGILRVELDALRSLPAVGSTLLRSVTPVDDLRPLPRGGGEATLPNAKNSLRFRVAAPGLAGVTNVEFETEMSGLGQGARHLSATPEREFTNLAEGRYVFRSRAQAPGGEWTTPVEFSFLVLPPWWRSPWAYALWAVLAAGGVAGIVTLRTRALRHRTARLEETVAKRTGELHESNQELRRLHRLELDEKISAKLAEEKARLEMLRYQLNPHFLFNTLNSLYGLVAEHPTASQMVLGLSEFCRLTLMRGGDQPQSLTEELQMLDVYLRIEKVRWGDSLHIDISAAPGTEAAKLPAFLLLPLVENAVKHGGATSRAMLEVRVHARVGGDQRLEVEIANTGHWLPPGASRSASTGTGLENLRQRLARYYPDAHTFTHGSAEGWVTVKLNLPLQPQPDTPPTTSSATA